MEKLCKNCGSKLSPDDKFCLNCGKKVDGDENIIFQNEKSSINQSQEKKIDSYAILAFIFSILGLIRGYGLLLAVISISMGISSFKRIKLVENEKGKGLAIASIVLGAVGVVITVIWFVSMIRSSIR